MKTEVKYTTDVEINDSLLLELAEGEGEYYKQILAVKLSLFLCDEQHIQNPANTLRQLDKWLEANPMFSTADSCFVETPEGLITLDQAEKQKTFLEAKSEKIRESHIGMLKDLIS